MITIHEVSAGSGVDYLESTVMAADVETRGLGSELNAYLASHGDTPGRWLGRGAARLELSGDITSEAADAIWKDGADPRTGELLGRRWPRYPTAEEAYAKLVMAEPQASPERRAALWAQAAKQGNKTANSGWEMVFAPVKSFSVAWGLADDAGRRALEAAEEKAFTAIVTRLEDEIAHTRIGAGGAAQVKVDGITAGVWIHRSSRAGDPNYHRHLVVSTKVPYTDPKTGRTRWLTIDSPPLFHMTVALSEQYTAELERQMARLGFLAAPRSAMEPGGKRTVREYLGVPAAAIKHFSARREQAENAYAEMLTAFISREGREPTRAESYRMYQAAALKNRPHKTHRGIEAEREDWRRRAAKDGAITAPHLLGERMRAVSRMKRKAAAPDWREQLPALVLGELTDRRASWRPSNVETEVTRQLRELGVHLDQARPLPALIAEGLALVLGDGDTARIDLPELVPAPGAYRRQDGESVFRSVNSARFTSVTLLSAERELVAAASGHGHPAMAAGRVAAVLAAGDGRRGFAASAEQATAVAKVFGSTATLAAVVGRAGVGKTTIMAMVKEVADAEGLAVLGLSTGQIQADILGTEAGLRTENVARWLAMSEAHPGDPAWTIAPGTVVIVDEAGQSGTLDLARLLAQVNAAGGGARLLLVGDPTQTGSVAAGGILAELESAGLVTARLTEVRRFRDHDGAIRDWEAAASLALSQGLAEQSYAAYEAHGRIHAGTAEAMAEQALSAYLADRDAGLASILIVPDNEMAASMSARIRQRYIDAGFVRLGREVALSDGNAAAIGDVVATRRIDRQILTTGGRGYVRNGDTWTVERVGTDGTLQVCDRISGARTVLPAAYVAAHVTLAYAITGHRAQGLTVDTAHSLVTDRMNRNTLYPSLTRGRYESHAYVCLTEPVDAETGEPGRPTTARHVWSTVVGRDGTEQSAHAAVRYETRRQKALSGLYARLRYTLDDLGDARVRQAATAAVGPLAARLTEAPAWPALAELLRVLDAEGYDPAVVVRHALAARSLDGALDPAAVIHARIVNAHPAYEAAAVHHVLADAEVAGPQMLHLLGILPPAASVHGEKTEFARNLGAAIVDRIAEVTRETEHADWALRLYGPVPEDADAAAARRARVQAAAVYRDLTDRTETSGEVLGPPPPASAYGLRVLWRRAQPAADQADLRARALAAALADEPWLRELGPAPVDDALYPAWATAAAAALEYRDRWHVGHEQLMLGHETTDRVQAADRAHASALRARWDLARWRGLAAQPPVDESIRRGVDQARAELYNAQRRQTRLEQHLDDLGNRLAVLRGPDQDQHAQQVAELEARRDAAALAWQAGGDRLRELEAAAQAPASATTAAPAEPEPAEDETEVIADPQAAEVIDVVTTLFGGESPAERQQDDEDEEPEPEAVGSNWRERTYGARTDRQLQALWSTGHEHLALGQGARIEAAEALAEAAAGRGPAAAALAAEAPRVEAQTQAIAAIRAARLNVEISEATHDPLAKAAEELRKAVRTLADSERGKRDEPAPGGPLYDRLPLSERLGRDIADLKSVAGWRTSRSNDYRNLTSYAAMTKATLALAEQDLAAKRRALAGLPRPADLPEREGGVDRWRQAEARAAQFADPDARAGLEDGARAADQQAARDAFAGAEQIIAEARQFIAGVEREQALRTAQPANVRAADDDARAPRRPARTRSTAARANPHLRYPSTGHRPPGQGRGGPGR